MTAVVDGSASTMEVTVTSFHASPAGGGILIGNDVDRGRSRRIRIATTIATREPKAGEDWRLTGRWVEDPTHGRQMQADVALPLLPQGEGIVRWIATNPSIPGVGRATAGRLWKQHGADLYRILRDGDAAALSSTVGPMTAAFIANEFSMLASEVAVLERFDRYGLSPATAIAAARLWGAGAIRKLDDDPYSLALLEPWRKVDERAARLGVTLDDPRRLCAAVQEIVARRYRGQDRGTGGHTAATRQEMLAGLRTLLDRRGSELAAGAFEQAETNGELSERDGLWQGRGPALMEREIERGISFRLGHANAPAAVADRAIGMVEDELGFRLDRVQTAAVRLVAGSRFCIVDGPAGTGKSTVTRAILRIAEEHGLGYHQIALSGRAAKRLVEATGHEAMTVHRFLKAVTVGGMKLGVGILVIDESSMIATSDLWQILAWIPKETGVVLVGDPGQLPPIGAGSPLAALVGQAVVPRATLAQVHRQSGTSPIPVVAGEVRLGRVPDLPAFDQGDAARDGVFHVPCTTAEVPREIMRVFEAFVGPPAALPDRDAMRRLHGARAQILGMTLRGPAGVKELADGIERRWLGSQKPIRDWGLAEGSKILWTRNSYGHLTGGMNANGKPADVDIMNGSLGIVQHATTNGAVVLFDDDVGTRTEIRSIDLDRVLRGWAITVHKAQGSAFDRVIIPIVPSRLLDREMIYTAITRARRTVVLVGDADLLTRAACTRGPSSSRRQCLRLGI